MVVTGLIALGVGVVLGLLGGGGSILIVPVLVYLLGLEPKEAIATSLIVVGGTAAAAAVRHAVMGNVRWRVGLTFSVAGMVGAAAGGAGATWFSGTTLLILFALMMGITGVAMLTSRTSSERLHRCR